MRCVLWAACLVSSVAMAEDVDGLRLETRQKAVPVLPKVAGMMKQTVEAQGVAAAIPVCKEQAPELLSRTAGELGWELRRVSLKTRNPERGTPDAWEARQLADFDARAARGEPVDSMEAAEVVALPDGTKSFRYLKAIPVAPVCLQCHGAADRLAPELSQELSNAYPHDRATGYELGQVRGALSVKRPL